MRRVKVTGPRGTIEVSDDGNGTLTSSLLEAVVRQYGKLPPVDHKGRER